MLFVIYSIFAYIKQVLFITPFRSTLNSDWNKKVLSVHVY